MVAPTAARLAKRQYQKYTVQPTGIWAWINRLFAVDHTRSSGVPLNPQFRNPPPGSVDPKIYDDPVTIPAGDIANNPYWKRDMRRRYPRLSTVTQGDAVALLTVGSKAEPNDEALQIGDAGQNQLVALKGGEGPGLAATLAKGKDMAKGVLDSNGMPPIPVSLGQGRSTTQYRLLKEEDQAYGGGYPCRTFS